MKRLGVFVSILMLSLGLFGGFSSPEKAFAVVTQSEYDSLKNYATEIDSLFNNAVKSKGASNIFNYTPSKKYLEILSKQYNQLKDNTASTKSILEVATLGEFKNYLETEIQDYNTSTVCLADCGVMADAYNVVLINTKQLSSNAISRVNLENNVITKEEHLQNSSLSASEAQKAMTERSKKIEGECSFSNPTNCINQVVTWLIKNTLLQVGGFLVWLTANMFNYAVQMGVLQFSHWAPDALYPIWTIVRQIISLVIVFAGLYLGFMYILGREDKFEKYIPWVIMFGLFVNFSYPLTRTLIDISNITSLNIYASAVGPDALTQEFTSDKTAGGLIMNKLGLQGLIGSAVSNENLGILSNVNSIPGALVAVAYVFYAAYIFFQVTAIFVMRTLALVFIIIASPLLLVDSVLPMLGEKAKELRGIFFNQLIVGPVFMIMLALTLKFLDVFSMGGPAMTSVGSGATGVETIKTFFNIMMMLGMLHIMIKVTKHFAGKLGEMANNAFGAVTGVGLGMATGGLGLAGRYGIGKAANYAQNKGWVSKDPNSMGGRIANTLSTSSFDIRNSSIIAGAAGKLGMNRGILGMGGMGGGAASKASFQSNADAKAKRIEASANARFKTKYERDTVDEDGFHRKGDDNLKQIKARQEFMASKGSSLFLTKEQQQKFIDDETDDQAGRSLSEYNTLKTEPEKVKRFKEIQQELAEAQKSDPKFETAKAQALRRTVEDIKKKTKDEDEAFAKEFDRNLAKYNALTGEKKKVYLEEQNVEEMRKSIETGKNLRAERRASENASTPIPTASSSTASTSSSSTPLVADTDWSQLNSPAVNRREKATTATTTPSPTQQSRTAPNLDTTGLELEPVNQNTNTPSSSSSPSSAPLTGIALREERIKKVAEGRGEEVKKFEEMQKVTKGTELEEVNNMVVEVVREKQQNSAAKAQVFASPARFAQRRAERDRREAERLNTPTPQNSTPAPQPTQQVEEEVTS